MVDRKPTVPVTRDGFCFAFVVLVFFLAATGGVAEPAVEKSGGIEAALKQMNLPGVTINIKERCVDVDSVVCLKKGVLEFVACTKNTKEHESLVAIEALPKHVHTALLLIGAKSGSPATRRPVDEAQTRWVRVPPSGDEVDVFLLTYEENGKLIERPISDFIERVDDRDAENDRSFPTHTFLFAGSKLRGKGDEPRVYLADISGSVISVATFGDELLCLPSMNAHTTGALLWQVNSSTLASLGEKVTLRLRPKRSKL